MTLSMYLVKSSEDEILVPRCKVITQYSAAIVTQPVDRDNNDRLFSPLSSDSGLSSSDRSQSPGLRGFRRFVAFCSRCCLTRCSEDSSIEEGRVADLVGCAPIKLISLVWDEKNSGGYLRRKHCGTLPYINEQNALFPIQRSIKP
jgi:hypothetical protein